MRNNHAYTFLTIAMLAISLPVAFTNCSAFYAISGGTVSESSVAIGEKVYATNCASCHGDIGSSTKANRTGDQIFLAIQSVPQMNALSFLSRDDADQLSAALGARTPGRKYVCNDTSSRGTSENGMRRLSVGEITNTLGDIFGDDVVQASLSTAPLPADGVAESISEFNPKHARAMVTNLADFYLDVGTRVTTETPLLARVAPACVTQNLTTAIEASCLKSFISSLGRLVHRRPLDSAQIQKYFDFYNASEISSITVPEKLSVLIARLLESPEFQFLYLTSPDQSGPRSRLDAYSVASRLSYTLTGSKPDDALLALAASGEILQIGKLQSEAARLFETPRGHQKVGSVLTLWLGFSKIKQPTLSGLSRAGYSTDESTQFWIYAWAMQEALDYFDYVVYHGGTFSDVASKAYSFPRYPPLAAVMKLPVWTLGDAPVNDPTGRLGLFARPAFLFNNGDRESPIKRGVFLRTKALCEEVPPPPANLDSAIADAGNAFDQTLFSSRDVASKVTAPGTCATCHSQLNSLGFALGNFGPAGEFRITEKTYSGDGTTHDFPIDVKVTNLNVNAMSDSAENFAEFTRLMSTSTKARACMAVNAFRITHMRAEQDADHCLLADLESMLLSGVTVKEAFIRNASTEDMYWKGN